MLSASIKSKSILLVDDEKDIREVLELALVDAGYEVQLAENGQQALDYFRKNRPSIVITDIKMPVMDGIQLLRKIKLEAPETEVVMITGHGDMDLAIRSLKYEATDFITKPIHVDALEVALKRVGDKILMRRKLEEYTANLERLLKEKSELQDHLSSLGLMIGSISHGIKGLLTGLDGGMYLLESGLSKKDEGKITKGWETIKIIVDRIRKMVLDILYYAKKRDLQWEKVDVACFAREVSVMVAAKVEILPITLTCDVDETLGEFKIDPGYIHAALMNIFDNAIDACQRGSDSIQHELNFSVQGRDDKIIFSVSDTGVGMDQETQSKLFTIFFSSKGRKGTGLGLFIANKIVEQHGGCIDVRSKPGKGSCFTITIPKQGS
ncbi:MAG: hybrid sensor histidine kinase/response regulator [Desulfobacteraceae bacterium]|nr:hybrid sensor histidine kinase/response regulator [Desulfobacteraceae bacterium]